MAYGCHSGSQVPLHGQRTTSDQPPTTGNEVGPSRHPGDTPGYELFTRSPFQIIFLCALLYAFSYGRTISHATFLNDDWFNLEPIPGDRLVHLFSGDWHLGYRGVGGFYRPLPRVLIQSARLGLDLWAPGYLLISAVLHLLNCYLVWRLALRLSRRREAAWVAALLFAVYPTHPEALLQLSMWPDLLAAAGYLIALNGYLALRESNAARNWLMALAGVLLAALSKESWATLPLVIVAIEWIWRANPERFRLDAKAWRRMAIFVGLGMIYVAFRQSVLGGAGGYGRPLTLASVRDTYDAVFGMVVLPFSGYEYYAGLLNIYVLLGGLLIIWALLDFPRVLLLGILWMVLTTLPLLTLTPRLHNGGRLVYIVVVGWALFVGGVLDALVCRSRTNKARNAISMVTVLVIFALLPSDRSADWRRSFEENRRLVNETVEVIKNQPAETRFAILSWPERFGVALSNRLDSAAKAAATLAGIEPHRIDALLAPDAPRGTITFKAAEDPNTREIRLNVGRVETVQVWSWAGDRLDQWRPWGNARLAHLRSDGSRDYDFDDREAGLVSPELSGQRGYYSILVCYHPARLYWGFVMWRGPREPFDSSRIATLSPLVRLGEDARLACPGNLSRLGEVLFLPATDRATLTVRSIEIARFDIAPLAPQASRR
jgi:hypothetical protein